MKGIELAGGAAVMLPLTDDAEAIARIVDAMDGYIFTSGHDVSPALDGEEKLPVCASCCAGRDAMERVLLPQALEKNRSVTWFVADLMN